MFATQSFSGFYNEALDYGESLGICQKSGANSVA